MNKTKQTEIIMYTFISKYLSLVNLQITHNFYIDYFFSDPPVFVEEHKIIQFRNLGEHIDEKVVAHSVSSITCCHIEGENGREIPHDMECIPENKTPFVHDSNLIIQELEIAFSFTAMQKSDYQKYKITLCNHDGNSSCIIELKLRDTGKQHQICFNL